MSSVKIEIVKNVSPQLLSSIVALASELSSSASASSPAAVRAVIDSPSTHLFVANDGTSIVGMLTLVLVQMPTGLRARIEDVVVTASHRRRGVGQALTKAAIEVATVSRARTIDLTSRPSRVDAIRLYERLGFQRRDTCVFRYSLEEGGHGE